MALSFPLLPFPLIDEEDEEDKNVEEVEDKLGNALEVLILPESMLTALSKETKPVPILRFGVDIEYEEDERLPPFVFLTFFRSAIFN